MENKSSIAISVVSHGQGSMISLLLDDLRRLNLFEGKIKEILLTINIPEDESFLDKFSSLPLLILRNNRPRGFGENHNLAFSASNSDIFMIINPDVRFIFFDYHLMLRSLSNPAVGLWAPSVVSPEGAIEDSARKYPTVLRLLSRVLLRRRKSDYYLGAHSIEVEWVAGMFMVFRKAIFESIGGFNSKYFLYMEDADICRRINKSGLSVVYDPNIRIIHNAQRQSHRSLKYLSWHVMSIIRFLLTSNK